MLSRRGLIAGMVAGAALVASPAIAALPTTAPRHKPRRLDLIHLHTGERLKVIYHADGQYVPGALAELDRFLRDWRTGEVAPVDPALYDLICELAATVDAPGAVTVICGTRSRTTNRQLAKAGRGAAQESLHLRGQAVDINVPGRDLALLRDAAWSLKRGGVGYYEKNQFLHIDTGRRRYWGWDPHAPVEAREA